MSCNQSAKKNDSQGLTTDGNLQDTVIVKHENKIDKSYHVGFYSKSFLYSWVVDNDTLDFKIGLTEYVRDSSVSLRIFHEKPILFSTALDKINECLPVIQKDFNIDNLNSLYFQPPIYYKDMTNELSDSYENKFGERNIGYQKQDDFLMNSWLGARVDGFLSEFNKSAERYGIEKFHLLEKEYYDTYIPNTDLTGYPDFSINGMGISVHLKDEK